MKNQIITKKSWWERNKKKVLIIGGIAVAVGISVVVFKNRKAIRAFIDSGKTAAKLTKPIIQSTVVEATSEITTVTTPQIASECIPLNNGLPFEVRMFIRNLPENRFPSPEKKAEALRLGIDLGAHQTIVDPHLRNVA